MSLITSRYIASWIILQYYGKLQAMRFIDRYNSIVLIIVMLITIIVIRIIMKYFWFSQLKAFLADLHRKETDETLEIALDILNHDKMASLI